jgi:hypothetical protein
MLYKNPRNVEFSILVPIVPVGAQENTKLIRLVSKGASLYYVTLGP